MRASAACRRSGAPPISRGEANLREPFERLVDTGLRLNELRSAAELHEFLIDEATELSGAERVLLVLETPQGLRLAGSLVPRGEDAQALMHDITPALMEVRRTRAASLTHSPEGANELDQRSRVVAPLIAQRQLLGYLYADLDGAFGRLRESDRDLLGMLASQAAVALDNAQWSQGLEQKVAQRTEELQASKALLEQRVNELAIINSIQQGMAGSSSTSRRSSSLSATSCARCCATDTIGIRWHDEADADCCISSTAIEHGTRLHVPPSPMTASAGALERGHLRTAACIGRNTAAEVAAAGIARRGHRHEPLGCRPCRSSSPATASLGVVVVENYRTRQTHSATAEVRLLQTIAASMGVALENARLFDETQRLLKETEQRAAELARDQQHPARHGRRTGLPGHHRTRRRQAASSCLPPTTWSLAGWTSALACCTCRSASSRASGYTWRPCGSRTF